MGRFAEIKNHNGLGDLADVYYFNSFETATGITAGKGTVAVIGPYNDNLIEVEILSNSPYDSRFVPGTKLYVDKDADLNSPTPIPVKNSSGVAVGYSVKLSDKREAYVEEELDMLKRRVAALENAG